MADDRRRRDSRSEEFDFVEHHLWIRVTDGHSRAFELRPMAVAHFYSEVMDRLSHPVPAGRGYS